MNYQELFFFAGFIVFILAILLFDLGVFASKDKPVTFKVAVYWTIVWVGMAMLFYFFLQYKGEWMHGITDMEQLKALVNHHRHPIRIDGLAFEEAIDIYRKNLSLEFLTGYIIEYSLSIDNIFVMIMIFMAFGVRQKYYKWVLFWGIAGAIVMRFIFIFVSSALIHRFGWILYIFGLFLVVTGIIMFINRNKESRIDPHHHPVVRFAQKYFAVYPRNVGHKFFIRNKAGKVLVTPLFLVLLVIEFTDVIFAVDSVPAIFSITRDPYIVFFSNIFAIIGLRSLFFLVMNVMNRFVYLKIGLSVLLTVIGLKMLLHTWLEEIGFTTNHSFYLVILIIGTSIIASLLFPGKKKTGVAS